MSENVKNLFLNKNNNGLKYSFCMADSLLFNGGSYSLRRLVFFTEASILFSKAQDGRGFLSIARQDTVGVIQIALFKKALFKLLRFAILMALFQR